MRRLPGLILCALTTLTASSSAALADDPATYKGRFEFATTEFKPISKNKVFVRGSLDGVETLLGKFTGEVEYVVDLTTGAFTGSLSKTSSIGDRLFETVTGQFTSTGSVGKFAITGGTGRFRGATGGGNFLGVWTDPALTKAHITFDGTLSHDDEGDFEAEGSVAFSNVQGATQAGGLAPYLAAGVGDGIGKHIQTGSILNTTGLIPIDETTLVFQGEVGPNPFLPGNPRVHVIDTKNGQIFCTWTAVFTLKIINARGDAVFSGDGAFTVIGGTGKYKGATGHFTTLFETQPVPFGADKASADYQQFGKIHRR
jgi:hypothetical protein